MDVGAAKLLDSVDLTKVLDKKTADKSNPVSKPDKTKQSTQPKFKPSDKIELTPPKSKGFEIAKSVR